MDLDVNALIDWVVDEGRVQTRRILWMGCDPAGFWSIDIWDNHAWPAWVSREQFLAAWEAKNVCFRLVDPFVARQLIDRPPEHFAHRDKNWQLIEDLVSQEPDIYNPRTRGPLYRNLSETRHIRLGTLHDLTRRFWQRGMTVSTLLPDWQKSGGPGKTRQTKPGGKKRGRKKTKDPNVVGINIDENLQRVIRLTGKRLYNDRTKPSIQKVLDEIKRTQFIVGFYESDGVQIPILKPPSEMPTYRQVRYWLQKELDPEESEAAREGRQRTLLTKRELPGDNAGREIRGPGARFEIDATPTDTHLVSRDDPAVRLGRATIYTIIDVFSRLVVGLWVGWEHPGWIAAMMALENMMSDKVAYAAKYGITIRPEEWPCHHIPRALVSDRGELFSQTSLQLIRDLRITRITAPPRRGDFKPYIERHFGLWRDDIRALPGGILDLDPGERDYRLSAALTLEDFTKILIHMVLEHNNTVISRNFDVPRELLASDIPLTPANVWAWGTTHASGSLRTAQVAQRRYALLPHRSATITREGVKADTLRFTADWARERKWFSHADIVGHQTIEVAYDPRTVDGLWWRDRDGLVYELSLRPDDRRHYGGLTWEEASARRSAVASRRAATENQTAQVTAHHQTHIKAITNRAEKRRDKAKTSHRGQNTPGNVRRNRQQAKAEQRAEERWIRASNDETVARSVHEPSDAVDATIHMLEGLIPLEDNNE